MTDASFGADRAGLEAALGLLLRELADPSGAALDLPASLPSAGAGELAALERLAPSVVGGARRLGAPGFLAHMDPPTPWVAWAGAQWAAALNQNLLHPDSAPVARELEERVVAWLAPFFGMSGGHLVPGSSVANLTALWAARELLGVEEVVASQAAHLSVPKAAAILGLRLPRGRPSRAGRPVAGGARDDGGHDRHGRRRSARRGRGRRLAARGRGLGRPAATERTQCVLCWTG